jgi:putative transposon-encoded protein
MRKMKLAKGVIEFRDEFETIIEKTVTKFGTGAKLDCPKEHIGKKAYIVIRKSR